MHRLTARLLLVFLLAGTFVPVAMASFAPMPHACCMRKPMHEHGSRNSEIQSVGGQNHNCCPPVTTAHWAEFRSGTDLIACPLVAHLPPDWHSVLRSDHANLLRPVRGPPLS